jgi:hypothetical protein
VRRFWAAASDYWLRAEPPFTLPFMRVVLVGFTVLVALPEQVNRLRWVSVRPLEFMDPPRILHWLPVPFPLTPSGISVFWAVMTVAGVLAAVGLATRLALLVFTTGYLYLGATSSAWGFMSHAVLGYSQVFLVLFIAPGTSAYSLDRWLRWRRAAGARPPFRQALAGPPVTRWGTRLVLAFLATILLAAGLSKLRYSGPRWADGRTLGAYLSGATCDGQADTSGVRALPCRKVWMHGYTLFAGPPRVPRGLAWRDGFGLQSHLYTTGPAPLGRLISSNRLVLVALSVGTLLFELSAPVMLGAVWLRNLYLLGGVAFFLGIQLTMPVGFSSWIPLLLTAVEWRVIWSRRLVRSLRDRRAAPLAFSPFDAS